MLFFKNEADIVEFFRRRQAEVHDDWDHLWFEQNRYAVCQSMIGLFQRLTGIPVADVDRITTSIEEWTFQIVQTTREQMGEPEVSILSMVQDGPTNSFLETRKRVANAIGDRPAKRRKE